MILTILFREFRVFIPKNEPKKILYHTDIYNIQTLHQMRFHKVSGEWIRRDDNKKVLAQNSPTNPRRDSESMQTYVNNPLPAIHRRMW